MMAMSTVAKRLQGWSRALAGRTFWVLNPGCPDPSPFNGSAPAVFRASAGSGRVDFFICSLLHVLGERPAPCGQGAATGERPFPGVKTILQCGHRQEEDLQRTAARLLEADMCIAILAVSSDVERRH
jgi:hypothetical protein